MLYTLYFVRAPILFSGNFYCSDRFYPRKIPLDIQTPVGGREMTLLALSSIDTYHRSISVTLGVTFWSLQGRARSGSSNWIQILPS